jgi:flagellar assembly factor FliW
MISALAFTTPPPGLAPRTEFSLRPLDGADGVYAMRAVDDDALRLFVLDAALYVPDYAPALGADTLAELGLEPDEDPFLLLVSSLRDDGPAVNLAAPIAVNGRTGSATQIVLDGQDWPLRQTLSPR